MIDLTPEQSRAARELLHWSQVRLGAKAGLGEGTIREFENGIRILRVEKRTRIRRAFEMAGVVFTAKGPSLSAARSRMNRYC
ncbi:MULTISPECIES: helix-turn-helix domain-containing protein [unclassified Mesorhizobium]|uniref:helix-turn-helix domain-containing protein n=1 Tax=unclassified Mesorhizobium TaxID=325217 RepID=UPI002479EABD|nr:MULTISPECIES: helix-turn-helix domain-containing protein [unclassified Mesorhizobium]